ncbi:MAG TPA: hypothetical protein VFF95_13650 [Candidatus Binatus sp.]|nr:hypothetical protein [Candidatus Binatus sp.]
MVDDFPEVVAGLNLVFDFAEDFADFVFDGVGFRAVLEPAEERKELIVDEVAEVVARESFVVVNLAVAVRAAGSFGSGPSFPAIGLLEEESVLFALELGFRGALLLERFEVLEEEEPGGLLGVVELGGAAGFLAENVVDVFEDLFEHGPANIKNLRVKKKNKSDLIVTTAERSGNVP